MNPGCRGCSNPRWRHCIPVWVTERDCLKKEKEKAVMFIAQKVKLLEKLDSSVGVKCPTEEYGVGMNTIDDLKKQKDKLVKFDTEYDEQKLMKNRKCIKHEK